MLPILTRYGSIFIFSYTVVLALGVVLALLLTAHLQKREPLPEWFDAALVVFAAAVAGGRFGFVIAQWTYFQENRAEIGHIWQGGLSYYGALFAGLAALSIWTRVSDRDYYRYAALFSPGAALIVAFGWAACWFDGCAYGLETTLGPLAADLPDEFGVFALRYQTQLIGLALSLLTFAIVLWLFEHAKPAVTFWFFLFLISAVHFLTGFLRGDLLPGSAGIRLDQLLDGILIGGSLLMLQYSRRHLPLEAEREIVN